MILIWGSWAILLLAQAFRQILAKQSFELNIALNQFFGNFNQFWYQTGLDVKNNRDMN